MERLARLFALLTTLTTYANVAVTFIGALRNLGTALFAWVARWQESVMWIPLLVAMALVGWVIFGTMDRTAITDSLSLLVHLPIVTAYALAALGLAHLARRRWRRKLTDAQQAQWWTSVIEGGRGAIAVLLIDAFVTVVLVCALLLFFSRSL